MASNANINSQTPLVLLISLERSKARRARAIAALEKLGLQYEWVRAIDGNELSDEEVAKIHSNQKVFKMSRGEIGCYLSHLKCLRIIRERKLPYALIMEDDTPVDEKLTNVLSRLARFPADWDIVNLTPTHAIRDDKMIAFQHPSLYHRKSIGDGLFVGRYFFGTWYAGLYLITSRYIAKFEKHLSQIRMSIDNTLFRLNYSPNFPYALYTQAQGECLAFLHHGTGVSEIDAIGGRGRNEEVSPIQPSIKTAFLDLLRNIYYAFDPLLMRVMLNMRLRPAGKPNYLDADYSPGALRLRIWVWRSCDWRFLPLALVRAMLPQRWL